MYRDNNFHSRREVLRVKCLKIMSQVSITLFMFEAGFPVFALFQDELEARKSLKAFCLQPKSQLNNLRNIFFEKKKKK